MNELISMPQANHLMILVLVVAPIIGLVWGVVTKQIVRCLVIGVAIGVWNFVLWTIYNAITDHLGLDTVKNLIVNLALFIILGVVTGILIGRFGRRSEPDHSSELSD
jgi:hypothetical protein